MHRPSHPRRPFVHHSKWRSSPRWLTVPNVNALAFAALVVTVYLVAFASTGSSSSSMSSDEGMLTSVGSPSRAGSRKAAVAPLEAEQDPPFHVVFSTSCSPFQDWQALLLFLTADMVGQKGPITRLASGCTEEQVATLETVYAKLDGGRGKFRLHATPDFSKDEKTGKTYYFYNKPGGLKHWLSSPTASPPDGTVIALIDPDFVFMRPLTAGVAREDGRPVLYTAPVSEGDLVDAVGPGQPVAQFYGIGDKWIEFNLTYIAGAGSPALDVKSGPAWRHYSIGPPYIAHKTDLARIAHHWHDFVPRVYEGHPHLLAEMYAYSVASAHLKLPHLRLDHYMTSEAEGYGEAWSFIDDVEEDRLCVADLSEETRALPVFLHYCQKYKVGADREFVFWKRDLDERFFACESEPLPLPAPEMVRGFLEEGELTPNERKTRKRHVFQYCQVALKANKALQQYQSLICSDSPATAEQ